MSALGRLCALALTLLLPLAPSAPVARAADHFAADHQFVVVTFANDPLRPIGRAGSNSHHYAGGSYGVAASAHTNAQRVADAYALKQVDSWPIRTLGIHCVVYEIPDSRSVGEVIQALAGDARITLAQPLQQFHTLTAASPKPAAVAADPAQAGAAATYNDPLYGLQTNLVSLGISAAHEHAQGAGVRVALIDTGVDTSHPDLQDRVAVSKSYVSDNLPANASSAWYRHGTAMAGLIAAVANNGLGIVGIAPKARLEVYAACWQLRANADEASCNTFTLAQALSAALEARTPIINLSIAGPADPLLSALVRTGLKRGVIFVGSTTAEPDSFPTNVAGVIGVGDSQSGDAAPGSAIRFAAPATHVLTLRPAGQYDFESGTSVAAAEMSGIAALMLSANPDLGTNALVSMLRGAPEEGLQMIDVNAALARVAADKVGGRLAQSGR